MTNKEAIKYLKQLYPNGGHCWLDDQRIEAIGMAVKALQEEPTAKEYLCIKDFYPYKKGKVYKSIDGGFPANAKEYFKLREEPVSIWHDANDEPDKDRQVLVCLSGNYYIDFYHKEDKRFYMFFKPKHYLHEVDKWAYINDLVNLSNVERTVKNREEPSSEDKMTISKEWFEHCKKSWYNEGYIDGEYNRDRQFEKPVSEDFEEALAKEWKGYNDRGAATVDALEDNTQELAFAKGFYRGAKWQEEKDNICYEEIFEEGAEWKADEFEKERLKQCDTLTKEQAKIESDFVTNFIKENNCTPTFIDAIEYGMKLKLKDVK